LCLSAKKRLIFTFRNRRCVSSNGNYEHWWESAIVAWICANILSTEELTRNVDMLLFACCDRSIKRQWEPVIADKRTAIQESILELTAQM
jgi:hypothetical protein